jgi:hypothetical protein
MVDSLKRSVEGLEAPTCPNCHLDMQWYRSSLIAAEARGGEEWIAHYFQCPNCKLIEEVRTPRTSAAGDTGPPRKLSRPADRFSCAA